MSALGLNDAPAGRLTPLDPGSVQRLENALADAAGFIDIAAIRTRLDGERELTERELNGIQAGFTMLPALAAKALSRLVEVHDARIAAKNAAVLAEIEAQINREHVDRQAARRAAWARAPRRLAEAAILASAFTPDGLSERDRDVWTPPPADALPREMLRLAALSDEAIRREPIPRRFAATMVSEVTS